MKIIQTIGQIYLCIIATLLIVSAIVAIHATTHARMPKATKGIIVWVSLLIPIFAFAVAFLWGL